MSSIKHISECFIKPKYEVKESNEPYYLAPWDLVVLSFHDLQVGLLYSKPKQDPQYSTNKLLETLKESLSLTLVHFYPLAGRLVTVVDQHRGQSMVYVDCKEGPGVRFTHATLDMTISDMLSPICVPLVVRSLFHNDRAVDYDGQCRPLLSVQVTELVDGVFIGCSMKHYLADGTSYWHFWDVWSELHRANGNQISVTRPPIHRRWFPDDGYDPAVFLPYTHPNQFITRLEAPLDLRERFFHFSSKTIARLKAKANEESKSTKISSFQALSALVWRSMVRASDLSHDQTTHCRLTLNNRPRLDPPLLQDYFGNSLGVVTASTTVEELLGKNLGWAAQSLNQAVTSHTDKVARDIVRGWLRSPFVYPLSMYDPPNSVVMVASPMFDLYKYEFGLGKAIAVRGGQSHRYPGKVFSYPGRGGGGGVDLEICLPYHSLKRLELDHEFMAIVSSL